MYLTTQKIKWLMLFNCLSKVNEISRGWKRVPKGIYRLFKSNHKLFWFRKIFLFFVFHFFINKHVEIHTHLERGHGKRDLTEMFELYTTWHYSRLFISLNFIHGFVSIENWKGALQYLSELKPVSYQNFNFFLAETTNEPHFRWAKLNQVNVFIP